MGAVAGAPAHARGSSMRMRSEGLSWQEIDGELVILDLTHAAYLTTNRSGAFLAKRLQQESSRQQLVDALATEYEIGEDRAGTDVDAFLATLAEKRLLT